MPASQFHRMRLTTGTDIWIKTTSPRTHEHWIFLYGALRRPRRSKSSTEHTALVARGLTLFSRGERHASERLSIRHSTFGTPFGHEVLHPPSGYAIPLSVIRENRFSRRWYLRSYMVKEMPSLDLNVISSNCRSRTRTMPPVSTSCSRCC